MFVYWDYTTTLIAVEQVQLYRAGRVSGNERLVVGCVQSVTGHLQQFAAPHP